MIALVLTMLRARRGQALTLALLALFAVAATVAAPAYGLAVDKAIVRAECFHETYGLALMASVVIVFAAYGCLTENRDRVQMTS